MYYAEPALNAIRTRNKLKAWTKTYNQQIDDSKVSKRHNKWTWLNITQLDEALTTQMNALAGYNSRSLYF